MTSEKKSFFNLMGSFKNTFWVASAMELFERWAWYGMFSVLALYLTGSTDEGALGFSHTEKGYIMGPVTAILYLLPIVTGVIADKIGYKLSLIIAYIILIAGYYLMGTFDTFWSFYGIFLLVALGAAMFKPVASAIVTKSTDKSNSTLGFGIFYMMVNVGGFIGPAMSSYLRTTYGWKLIFIQAAVVITINLLIVLFFFKEPYRVKTEESFGEAIWNALKKIVEAVMDVRLTVLLIIMVGFWTMFNQLFYTLPTFIEDWVDTKLLHDKIASFWPWLARTMSGGGDSVNPEWLVNIDAGAIVILQALVSFFVLKMRHVSAMIRGFIIAAIGIGITFYTNNGLFTILGIVIFAIGEMMTNPTFSSFIAIISPKGKEALYQGAYFLPVAAGNFFTTFVSGNLYDIWSDKLNLVKDEMSNRNIEMREVGDMLSRDEFISKTAEALNWTDQQVADKFVPADATTWEPIVKEIRKFAADNEMKLGELSAEFSKNDYFELAATKLNMNVSEMTRMIWDNYNPNKIWYVIVGIGIVTILALTIYDKMVIRPKEANEPNQE